MSNLETRVNNYINNELLDFNNINTNELKGKDYMDSILNRLFSRKLDTILSRTRLGRNI